MSNEGRFLVAGGHAVIRVYEVSALQGPHVTNENTPAVVDSNFTSLHFVRKPSSSSAAAAVAASDPPAAAASTTTTTTTNNNNNNNNNGK